MEEEKYKVVIIGSGIAGMTAAIYLKRAGIDPLVIEEDTPGGQLNKINVIENYPGFIKTDGPTLCEEIYKQVESLEVEYLYDKVIKTNLTKKEKEIITVNKKIKCDYLIIATGRLSKKLFRDDDDYAGKGISYCALCDGNLYKGKNVAVVGGGNSALEEVQYLSNICKNVTIISRSEELIADEALVEDVLARKNVKVVYNSNVSEYNIENGKLQSVLLDTGKTLEVSGLFISIGSSPSAEIFNVEKSKGFINVNEFCETSVENVYACGDVIKKVAYQLTTAAGEATTAAYEIIKKDKKH